MTEAIEQKTPATPGVSDSTQLLDCPTCDGARVVPMRSMFGAHYYECVGCGRMSSLFGHGTKEEAAAAWNERRKTI